MSSHPQMPHGYSLSDIPTNTAQTRSNRSNPPPNLSLPRSLQAEAEAGGNPGYLAYDDGEQIRGVYDEVDFDRTPVYPTFGSAESQNAGEGRERYLGPSGAGVRPSEDNPRGMSTQPSLPQLVLSRTMSAQSADSDTPLQPSSEFAGAGAKSTVQAADYAATPPQNRSRAGTVNGRGTPNQTRVHYPPTAQVDMQGGKPGEPQRYINVPLGQSISAHASAEDLQGERGRKRTSGFRGILGNSAANSRTDLPADGVDPSEKPPVTRASPSWGATEFFSRHGRSQSRGGSENADSPSGTPTPGGYRSGVNTPRVEWEGFDFNPANAKVDNLKYAEGDVGTTKLAKGYYYLLSKSIVTRWILYIFPILALLWIPGIVWLAGARDAKVYTVPLLWWSIWLTVVWAGWWAALASAMCLPPIAKATIGNIVPGMRTWVDIARALIRPAAFIGWSAAVWISFTPLVINQYTGPDQTANSRTSLTTVVQLLFGVFLSSLVVGAEKLVIQLISYRFHTDSYEDRIQAQKVKINALVTLYVNSRDIPGRRDTMTEATFKRKAAPTYAVRRALKGLRNAAQATTTSIGNVVSEAAGTSVLQTNSPYNKVQQLLSSANKAQMLARRLFYSFRKEGADHVSIDDVAKFFPDRESAEIAFSVIDADENGDCTRQELDLACISLHREKMSLQASIRAIDGAVSKLDDIFMFIVSLIVLLIMAAMITTQVSTMVTSAGTFVLGLSWLIGTTMQEIIGACIFLFVKHPFDVGDRVEIESQSYVVASMSLMSTTFKRVDGTTTWLGNDILRSKYILNLRRSGPISEAFVFEVDYGTEFKALQSLRDKMLAFLKEERRDFFPVFDVIVSDIPAQGKMVLSADVKYKTQEPALKVKRKNKWICALKTALAESHIWGPAGAGNPTPDPADPVAYTLVPYSPPAAADAPHSAGSNDTPPPDFASATRGGLAGASLLDSQQALGDAGFEQAELGVSTAREQPSPPDSAGYIHGGRDMRQRQRPRRAGDDDEQIEMTPPRGGSHV